VDWRRDKIWKICAPKGLYQPIFGASDWTKNDNVFVPALRRCLIIAKEWRFFDKWSVTEGRYSLQKGFDGYCFLARNEVFLR
jgi:hypothetical protein